MTYGPVHKFLLRSITSQGVISLEDTKKIISSFTEEDYRIEDLVHEINNKVRPFKQKIKIANDELTTEEVLVFLSLGYDDATKSQNVFTATELEYFRVLVEKIMTTDSRQITGIHALNLVSNMKSSFTKTDAQKLLDTWCRMRYLDKMEFNYALGIRAIHEFEGYLRENLPDTIEECCLCKQVVFRGYNCYACAAPIHTRCLNKYLEKVQKWPCCKVDFDQAQLERLNSERLTQTQHIDQTQHVDEDNTTTDTVMEESTENELLTQDIIPEISQRVTRKRKRNGD